ncbi:MAG: hypothetical protein FWC95_06160 [Defluviitaleaceae bacterium]|nr:hypothetical protein [Defluviitaleaceae bacterium]
MVISFLFLSACRIFDDADRILNTGRRDAETAFLATDHTDDTDKDAITLTVLQETTLSLAPLEPQQGILLGANISMERRARDFAAFERLTGHEHAINALIMTLCGVAPANDILLASLTGQAILLTILPPFYGNIYNLDLVRYLAIELGRTNTPIFVNLYPFARHFGFRADDYIDFYRSAVFYFRRFAPNTVMVWSTEVWEVFSAQLFFPGDGYVDWAGLDIPLHLNTDGGFDDFMPHFRHFMHAHQMERPIMVTGLSISHFSTVDNRYRAEQAASAIVDFYEMVAEQWPRVRAIVYFGYNELAFTVGQGRNNTTLLSDEAVLQAYRAAVSGEMFLPRVVRTDYVTTQAYITLPEAAVLINGVLYIGGEPADLHEDMFYLDITERILVIRQ